MNDNLYVFFVLILFKYILNMATTTDTQLNKQQLTMLRLLKSPLPESEFQKVRRYVVRLLADQLDEVMRDWEKENDITEEDYIKRSQGHFRTPSS